MQRAALKANYFGDAYMPLILKGVLLRHGLTQLDWEAAVIQTNGRPMSEATGSLLINRGHWPRATPAESIRKQTEDWLLAQGVPLEALRDIWRIDTEDSAGGKRPSGAQSGQRAAPRLRLVQPNESDFEPMEVEMLSPQAKRHFKLFRDPFDDIAHSDDVFLAADQRYVAEAMYQTAKHGGFLCVVGESGSGKTTLRKLLLERLREQPVRVIFPQTLDKSKLTTGNICTAIINDLAPGTTVRASLEAQARQVREVLLASAGADFAHVLVIEEAHDLSISTLKYLKRFYEIEDGMRRLLSIVLIAQPEMKAKLDERRHPEAREVIRRIEVAELLPLGLQLEAYLAHRLKRVNVEPGAIFAPNAAEAIRLRWTRTDPQTGQPRSNLYPLIINNTVVRAMNRAAELGAPLIDAHLIKEV